LAASDDWAPQLVQPSPLMGLPACSPVRDELVLTVSSGDAKDYPDIWAVSGDWAQRRLLAEDGAWPTWSPDGDRVVFFRHSEDTTETQTWVADLDGGAACLPIAMRRPPILGLDWVSADSFAVVTSEGPESESSGFMHRLLPGSGGHAVMSVWDLAGNERTRCEVRVSLDPGLPSLAARPGRDQVAFSAGPMSLLPSPAGTLLLADIETGKVWRIPTDIWNIIDLAWSPDGKALAISGMSVAWDPVMGAKTEARPEWGIWLVTGW
jgi:hypothetical protein